jgi:hypothetical protein
MVVVSSSLILTIVQALATRAHTANRAARRLTAYLGFSAQRANRKGLRSTAGAARGVSGIARVSGRKIASVVEWRNLN